MINPDDYYYPEFLLTQKILRGEWIFNKNTERIYNKNGAIVSGYVNKGYRMLKIKIPQFRPAHMKYSKAIYILDHGGICHPKNMEIDHLNTKTLDDRLANLELKTRSDNCRNPNSYVCGEKHWLSKTTQEQHDKIYQLRKDGMSYPSIKLAMFLEISPQQVRKIYLNEEKKHADITN